MEHEDFSMEQSLYRNVLHAVKRWQASTYFNYVSFFPFNTMVMLKKSTDIVIETMFYDLMKMSRKVPIASIA